MKLIGKRGFLLLAAVLLLIFVVNANEIKLEAKRPKQRTEIRSWINMLQGGILEGSLKYSTQGKLDCTQEGMRMVRALFNLVMNRIIPFEEPSFDDIKATVMLVTDIKKRCNYLATIEGFIISMLVRNMINDYLAGGVSVWINWILVIGEVLINVLDDIQEFVMIYNGFKKHQDFYNFGLFLGRIIKNVVAFYIEGWHSLFYSWGLLSF